LTAIKYIFLDRQKIRNSDAMLQKTKEAEMQAVIPPKKNRKAQRDYDKYIHRLRHLVGNAFPRLKR
jgi:hypothetical protein